MNIRRKVFSFISEIEERAFSEGYNAALADDEDYRLYEQDEKDRKKRRIGGNVALALGGGVSGWGNAGLLETFNKKKKSFTYNRSTI